MAFKKEISSIIKAAEVMKCLSEGDNQLSGIARKLGYDKSTVHRVLKTLEKIGLARQHPVNLRFYPGPLLHTLSNNSLKSYRILNEIAIEHMEALKDVSQETVNLQIPIPYYSKLITAFHAIGEFRDGDKDSIGMTKVPIDYYGMFHADTELYGNTPAFMLGRTFLGIDKIVFGTEFPFDRLDGEQVVRQTINAIEEMIVSDQERKMIYENNARKIMHLPF